MITPIYPTYPVLFPLADTYPLRGPHALGHEPNRQGDIQHEEIPTHLRQPH